VVALRQNRLAKSPKRSWPNFRSNNFVQSKRRASNTAVPISTHHAAVDYTEIAKHAKLIRDTRNAMAKIPTSAGQVWKT
jgi:UDP-N-acetyl-D-glucosamine dehydrogenase